MLSCRWMEISLRSPIILASLSLCSKPDLANHLRYFQRAANYGVGAIILPSIHPLRMTEAEGAPHVRTATIPTGLHGSGNQMGFAILGTTDCIVSIEYGLALAQQAVKLGIPILGSIANIGTEDAFLNVIHILSMVPGLSGLELNFSCPNVHNGLTPSLELLEKVQNVNKKRLPITIKLTPRQSYDSLLGDHRLFQGITLSNAYTGLVPPQIDANRISPFDDMEFWRPTGIYGPQEKIMTFYDIWTFKSNPRTMPFALSSVGGFVNGNDIVQALMLGADSIQLSSAVFWNGLSVIQQCTEALCKFIAKQSLSLSHLKGMSLQWIKDTDTDIDEVYKRPIRSMWVNPDKCQKCESCFCVERICYAFNREDDQHTPTINKALCSGCGWCQKMCQFNAVEIYN